MHNDSKLTVFRGNRLKSHIVRRRVFTLKECWGCKLFLTLCVKCLLGVVIVKPNGKERPNRIKQSQNIIRVQSARCKIIHSLNI